ncbi:MAG TPA: GNAT family protein [Marmoricola sp.]
MPDNQYGQPIGDPVEGWRPRTPVGPVVLDGIHCRVEPLEGRHTDDLYDTLVVGSPPRLWTYLSAGPFDDRVPFEAYVESLHANAGWSPHVVVPAAGPAAGRSAGIACYLRCDPAAGSVEVGGLSFAAAIQRTPATSEAMFMMARHVFEDLGYRRYEWKCDALNAASRAAATRLGFTFEGTFRQALVYKDRNRDTAWFSITDAEWPLLRPAHEAWLAPSNFDSAGRQLRSLGDLRTDGGPA